MALPVPRFAHRQAVLRVAGQRRVAEGGGRDGEGVARTPGVVDKALDRPLHALVTLRKCSTLYNVPTNSPFNTGRAPAGAPGSGAGR